MNQTTRVEVGYVMKQTVLYMAMELAAKKWRLGFSDGGKSRRAVVVEAGDRQRVMDEIARQKAKLGLAADARVVACYEAGRDGHWIHRWLTGAGVDVREVDSSSIALHRRGKQVKTDGVDLVKLLEMLIRVGRGDTQVWREVRVPPIDAEDEQRRMRERWRLQKEVTAHSNRISSLLVTQGLRLTMDREFEVRLEAARLWDGRALEPELKAELGREHERYRLAKEQLRGLEKQQVQDLRQADDSGDPGLVKMRRLCVLCGIGVQGSWLLVRELFGWRRFQNRREVGACMGLTPTPYNSGQSVQEQGISKAGNRRVRSVMIELSWLWLRYQPDSALSRWFQARFGGSSKRSRRVGIVALARKLAVALWHYLEHGVIPEGAVLKAA